MSKSIVLSTYNGEKYLIPLLDSLKMQTVKADEVLIFDDRSTDNTVGMIEAYIDNNNLDNWKIEVNTKNLGWQDNFWQGIQKATGDFIFPCDQDDIWDERKIELMSRVMEENLDISVLASDYKTMYMDGSVRFPGTKLSPISNELSIERIVSNKGLLVVDRPGCTYCIRKTLIPQMRICRFEKCPHDALAWRVAWQNKGLAVFHFQSIIFRRHSSNFSDGKIISRNSRIELAQYYVEMLEYLSRSNIGAVDTKHFIKESLQLHKRRQKALENGSVMELLVLITKTHLYPSIRTYIADIICLFRKENQE